eukprot:TRINITY_DN5879_c0_g1_i1.p1 TRINITY_DN5879_c0_g1~~TRINITY_DN5879_c0_g1_i1.p1  ORF type:complete len:217 (-),score=32.37 TRINITY_DN5879_c0_g1_i1:44-694(-)
MTTEEFSVLCAYTFNVLPVRVNEEYEILEVSPDGTKWRARRANGQIGWIPARYCRRLEEAPPVPLPAHATCLSENLLSFLDNIEVGTDGSVTLYMPEEPTEIVQPSTFDAQDYGEIGYAKKTEVSVPTYDIYKPSTSSTREINMMHWNSNTGEMMNKPTVVRQLEPEPKPEHLASSVTSHAEPTKSKSKKTKFGPKKKITTKKDANVELVYAHEKK